MLRTEKGGNSVETVLEPVFRHFVFHQLEKKRRCPLLLYLSKNKENEQINFLRAKLMMFCAVARKPILSQVVM